MTGAHLPGPWLQNPIGDYVPVSMCDGSPTGGFVYHVAGRTDGLGDEKDGASCCVRLGPITHIAVSSTGIIYYSTSTHQIKKIEGGMVSTEELVLHNSCGSE